MKIKTSELKGAQLDWAVLYARCLQANDGKPIQARDLMDAAVRNGMASPSADWGQGGPIIEREKITLHAPSNGIVHRYYKGRAEWVAHRPGYRETTWNGPTPLIAAMRCFVASKLGDEVEVPEELAA